MRFRSDRADQGKVFQDSGVAVAVPDGKGKAYTCYGIIESIQSVELTHATAASVLFFVRCYRTELVGPDPMCSNVWLIQAEAATSSFLECSLVVSASQVVPQVFFTHVPDKISLGRPWVWVLRYASSSYVAMAHGLEEEEEDNNNAEDMNDAV